MEGRVVRRPRAHVRRPLSKSEMEKMHGKCAARMNAATSGDAIK
jgi:hypothetical protein